MRLPDGRPAGITAYTVLSGADFGAGLWTLIPGGGRAGVAATRDHTRHSIGPVWEANHVWLIFVLTVAWTCYPVAFGSIVSTLSIPLFIAAVGIIFRGSMYALRSQLESGERRVGIVEDVFALSSVLTPFALATVIGGIATGRVPVGNARGNLVTSGFSWPAGGGFCRAEPGGRGRAARVRRSRLGARPGRAVAACLRGDRLRPGRGADRGERREAARIAPIPRNGRGDEVDHDTELRSDRDASVLGVCNVKA
ncbi:MAG: cytochrome d ubiquinol oxidase subunit II [Streptosporangiaceae bacterium]